MNKEAWSARKRDEYVDKELDKLQARCNRQRDSLEKAKKELEEQRAFSNAWAQQAETNREQIVELSALVESMSDKLCRCGEGRVEPTSPRLAGSGSVEDPFELEYASEGEPDESSSSSSTGSYHEAPVVSSEGEVHLRVHGDVCGCPVSPIPEQAPLEEIVMGEEVHVEETVPVSRQRAVRGRGRRSRVGKMTVHSHKPYDDSGREWRLQRVRSPGAREASYTEGSSSSDSSLGSSGRR